MKDFTSAYNMARNHQDGITIVEEAYEVLDKLVKESWHVWITAENNRETMRKATSISDDMEHYGIANFKLNRFTVDLWENNEGFGYSLYPYGAEPDEDGEFDEDGLIDGGEIECDTLAYALEYIDAVTAEREVA